jgi:pentapeptide MXKDX repeat protein
VIKLMTWALAFAFAVTMGSALALDTAKQDPSNKEVQADKKKDEKKKPKK